MKQIYYVIQALIHGRGANIIKVVSLGLGLTMSILLFSRVVYEQSFDTCFKDHDKLYQLWNIWTVNGEPFPPSEFIIGAAAGGILDAMPEIVESAAKLLLFVVASALLAGCTSYKNVPYMQNPEVVNSYREDLPLYDAKIMPKDLLSITVNTSDPQAAAPFIWFLYWNL